MISKNFKYEDVFQSAYKDRLNNDLDIALEKLVSLRVFFEINSEVLELEKSDFLRISEKSSEEFAISYLALEISLARKSHGFDYAMKLIQHFKSFSPFNMVKNGFWQIENGLTHFALNRSSVALEYFLGAQLVFENNNFKRWSLVNILFCKENLGQSLEDTLNLVKYGEQCEFKIVENQLRAFFLRYDFRKGHFKDVFKEKFSINTQAGFYQSWIKEIPYVNGERGDNFDELIGPQSLMSYRFRYNTLQGYLINDDLTDHSKVSEYVDRIYLWTWRWLVDDSNEYLKKVLRIFSKFDLEILFKGLTMEDSILLSNSLRWIKLFTFDNESKVDELLGRVEKIDYSLFPVLKLENLIISYWQAVKENDVLIQEGLLKSIEQDFLFKNNEVSLNQLIKLNGSSFDLLVSKLKELKYSASQSKEDYFVVNERAGQIINKRSGEIIRSDQLAKACIILFTKSTITETEFALHVLSLFNYDPIDHKRRIHGLLARLKSIFSPNLNFGIKEGRVFVEGVSANIKTISYPMWKKAIDDVYEWRFVSMDQGRVTEQVSKKEEVDLEAPLSRTQLEKLLGKSRSAAGRLLAKLESENKIVKQGKARGTRYILKPTAIDEIEMMRLSR